MRTPDFRNERKVPRRPHAVAPALASVRAIFVIHRHRHHRHHPSYSGLGVTVNGTAKVLRRSGVHCETWDVESVLDLFSRLERDSWASDRHPTHVIINTPNFATRDDFANLATRWPEIEFVLLNHSGLAYLSIDYDGIQRISRILDLQMSLHNVRVAGNSQRFGLMASDSLGSEALYLPNLYDVQSFVEPVVAYHNPNPLRVGCFGEPRPWKNQLVAAQAAMAMARRMNVNLELHVNLDPWGQNKATARARAQLLARSPSTKLIEVPWAPWPEFRRTVGHMHVCLHPSFDETFCVVCADALAEGVPTASTGAMEWLPRSAWVEEPWDPASVCAKGMSLLHNRIGAVHDGRRALTSFVEAGTTKWIDYLIA